MKIFFLLFSCVLTGVVASDCVDKTYQGKIEGILGSWSNAEVKFILKPSAQKGTVVISGPPGVKAFINETMKVLDITSVPSLSEPSSQSKTGPFRFLEYVLLVALAFLLVGNKPTHYIVYIGILILFVSAVVPHTDAGCSAVVATIPAKEPVIVVPEGSSAKVSFACEGGGEVMVMKQASNSEMEAKVGYKFMMHMPACQWKSVFKKVYTHEPNKAVCAGKVSDTVTVAAAGNKWKIGSNEPQEINANNMMNIPVPRAFDQQSLSNITQGSTFSHVWVYTASNGYKSRIVPVIARVDGTECRYTFQCESGDCLASPVQECGMYGKAGNLCSKVVNCESRTCLSYQCTAVCAKGDCSAPTQCTNGTTCPGPSLCTCPQDCNDHSVPASAGNKPFVCAVWPLSLLVWLFVQFQNQA